MEGPGQILEPDGTSRRTDGYLPIESYAAIGDGRSVALVGIDGSIDWMCVPAIDSPSVFAAILDPAEGGSFSLAPAVPYRATHSYLEHSNVLRTRFETADGTVLVTDALTIDNSQNAPWRELVRRVEGVSGAVPMQWRLRPRFDFGREAREPVHLEDALVYRYGELQLALRSWDAGEASVNREAAQGGFTVHAGDTALLTVVASDDVALPIPDRAEAERRLEATMQLWRDWLGRCTYDGPWRKEVERSLLTIRLLADGRTGAIAAAATSSLPEVIGDKRNYDYRFGWVRDLAFTVDALLRVGMDELSHASVGWLLGAVQQTHPRVDPVYSLTKQAIVSQTQLRLAGYRGTQPVHLGNQAGSQLQLGGVGDLIETIWRYTQNGHVLAPGTAERIADCVDLMCAIWRHEDAGLWELGDYAQYTTSKISCWTALERLLDLVEAGQAPARHLERWQRERDLVREYIETELWSDQKQSYVMKAGSDMLDCGVLLAGRRNYLDPKGKRFNATIDALGSELHADGPLLYRYSGMQQEENAFLACSFWMVEALALAGRHEQAAEVMDGVVALANDVGLYSEEMEPGSHHMRGNFPQALSHLALVTAADIFHSTSRHA